MEVVAVAFWIGVIGWICHRRRLRGAQDETELMEPQTWQAYTELWNPSPTQARMPTRTQRWLAGDAPETTLWQPDQTMPWMPGLPTSPKPVMSKPMMSKPVVSTPAAEPEPETWPVTCTHAVLLVVTAIAIALLIVGLGVAV